jgi:hypothetical protein
MADIPKLKKMADRRNINIVIDKKIDELYRLAKQNGYNASEIARQAVTDVFMKIENQIKRPAS